MKGLLLPLLLVALGCATGSANEAAPSSRLEPEDSAAAAPDRDGVRFPVRLDHGFRLVDTHEYDDPRLGIRLTYVTRQHELRTDVFVYPMAPPGVQVSDSLRAELLRRAFEQSEEDVRRWEKRGRYENVAVVREDEVRLGSAAGAIDGRHAYLRYDLRGKRVDSHLYVFTFARYFVKVRSTFPRAEAADRTQIVESFVEAYVPALRVAPQPQTQP